MDAQGAFFETTYCDGASATVIRDTICYVPMLYLGQVSGLSTGQLIQVIV